MKNCQKMERKQIDNLINAFILGGMTLVMVITTIWKLRTAETGQAMLLVAAFGSLMGVLANVFSANGKILTFLFGLFDVSIYGVMCFIDGKYGNSAMHLLYFLPMQIVGFWQWRKRGAEVSSKEESSLKVRRFGTREWLIYSGIFLAGLLVAYAVLLSIGRSESASVVKVAIFMDAFSMMCNILGQLLMSMAYMEQWYFWIGVNVASVIMWAVTLKDDPSSSYALVYMIKYIFYLLNSLNGVRIWLRLSK